jgi:phenylacetate-CoA ligase
MWPQVPGAVGLAVVTNLLNEAMPFIRYVQGDYVRRPAAPAFCSVSWSQLASVEGRVNDSFVNRWGREVPAGTILDVTNRWMHDTGVNLSQFELHQEAPDRVHAVVVPDRAGSSRLLAEGAGHLEKLLAACLEHPVTVELEVLPRWIQHGKRRPIQRRFALPMVNHIGS